MNTKNHSLPLLLVVLGLLLTAAMPSMADEKIRLMTFNVPKGNIPAEGLNTWPNRAASICRFLSEARPDLLGMQEPVVSELTDILSGIKGYTMIGVARDDGAQKGEYSPIIYRTDRFVVERSGTYWLSLTPDRVSKNWNSACNRIATWAIFRDKRTGARFLYTNTHLDHISSEARYNQMHVIKEHMRDILATEGDIPAFLTGDFNSVGTETSNPVTEAMNYLTPMKDAYKEAATRHGVSYTFPSAQIKIDFIMITAGVSVSDAWIHNSYYDNGQKISDHNAHYADLSWPLTDADRAAGLAAEAQQSIDSLTIWSPTGERLLSATTAAVTGDGVQRSSSYANLIDGSSTTVYYSAYSSPLPPAGTHFIEADLKRSDVSAFTVSLLRFTSAISHAPTELRVYGSTDGSNWRYITDISSIEYDKSGRFTSSTIALPEPMRYVRLYVMCTAAMDIVVSGPRFALSELNLLLCTADSSRSPRLYDAATAAAADDLAARAAAAVAAPSGTTIDALSAALTHLRAVNIPVQQYDALLSAAEALRSTHTVGEDLGQTTAEAAGTFHDGTEAVKASVPAKGTKAQYEAGIASLRSLCEAFEASLTGPEEGKWYYIVNKARIQVGTTRSRTLYVDSIDTTAPLRADVYGADKHSIAGSASPYAMWRFMRSAEGKGYTLQNRGTGFYLGTAVAGDDSCYTCSLTPVVHSLTYPASGTLSVLASPESSLCLSATQSGLLYNETGGAATAAAWGLQPVADTLAALEIPVRSNSISIMCLPFRVEGVSALNSGVKAYTVAYIPPLLPNIYLQRKDTFAAGEPFVLLVGTPTSGSAKENAVTSLRLKAADELVTAAGSNAGLHGTLDKGRVPASLYFEDNILRNHSGLTTLDGRSGYIVRSEAPTSARPYDLKINTNTLVNAIVSPRLPASADEAVYTLDGLRLKDGTTPARGIYIKGGRKLLQR